MADPAISIRRVLVPVDFSDHSAKALEYAIAIAKALGSKIDLIHAYHVPVAVQGPYTAPIPVEYTESIRKGAQANLDEWLQRVTASGVSGESHLVQGPPAVAITDAAQALGVDHIVMGTRGLTGLRHVILGSVAERTVRLSACPVTTVP